MKTMAGLFWGMMAVLLVVPAVRAQAASGAKGGVPAVQRSVDGSIGTRLRSGAYAMITIIGQPVAGRLPSRTGSIWPVQQRLQATRQAASLSAELEVPWAYGLGANYPNPFNPETVIEVSVPASGRVSLVVYDVLGREVARLLNGEVSAGRHRVFFDGRGLASGVYVYRMTADAFAQHRTMLLVK